MKKLISITLTVIMMFSMTASAFAAGNENITAILNRDLRVSFDGEFQTFTDVNGNIVYPLSYNDTTYLPVRATSVLVDLPISWDGANYTVVLGGDGEVAPAAKPVGTPVTGKENVAAILNKTLKVTYNGELQTFTDANGKVVYPISYNDTTYLPVRAISNLVQLPIDFDSATYSVVLGEKAEQPVTPPVTDNKFERGVWNGNVYTNEFANLKYTLDANSVAYTDEDIEYINELVPGTTYDMIAQNLVNGTLTTVMFVDLSVDADVANLVTTDMYIEVIKALLVQDENCTIVGTDSVELGGNDYQVLKTTNAGIVQNYYIMKLDPDYIVSLSITGPTNEAVNAAAACFN